jgi:hypothetical protein
MNSLLKDIKMFLVRHLFPSCHLGKYSTLLMRLYSLLFRSGSVGILENA